MNIHIWQNYSKYSVKTTWFTAVSLKPILFGNLDCVLCSSLCFNFYTAAVFGVDQTLKIEDCKCNQVHW